MFIGIPDPGVWLAYVLSVLSSLLCVGWGIARWNSGAAGAPEAGENTVRQWADKEDKLKEKL